MMNKMIRVRSRTYKIIREAAHRLWKTQMRVVGDLVEGGDVRTREVISEVVEEFNQIESKGKKNGKAESKRNNH